ncbi:alpha/beta hydrolase-fold protein [Chryseolinea sp. T2]|uniref:alpha/beta hydrolase-fold protein n=1 Tax=Chryseolinea sp. T2 TaxID=3129255 RepID=UPI003076B751
MKSILSFVLVVFNVAIVVAQVPIGDIVGPLQLTSRVYPGTTRNYWYYVPKQYDASAPACLMVVQDGLGRATGWRLPQVMDSLIAAHRIPVMIGVFVDPGSVTASREGAFPRYNRSLEYDALGDRYATFLAEELLPEVEKKYNIKKDPDSRAIAGASSGAICAFNVAWERPDQFRRVLSTIGTYVGLRGADEFTTLVRKSEPKPIRVFLEDGNSDLNIYAGDWWTANQAMLSALTYGGYEVEHSWGTGGHDSKHASSIMGQAMDWLWKDYPAPVATHKGIKPRMDLLIDGEPWKEVTLKGQQIGKFTADKDGNLFFVDHGSLYKMNPQNEVTKTNTAIDVVTAGPSGLIGWVKDGRKIVSIENSGETTTLATHSDVEFMYSTARGIYFGDGKKPQIGYYNIAKKNVRYFTTDFIPAAVALSAEKTFLNVASSETPFGYSFKVNEDGSIDYGQPYVHYHIAYGTSGPGVQGMDVDAANALYSATDLGVQVSDQLGRVNFIFSKTTKRTHDVKLVGDRLYVSGDGKLFVRKISAQGIRSFDAPSTPPKPQM